MLPQRKAFFIFFYSKAEFRNHNWGDTRYSKVLRRHEGSQKLNAWFCGYAQDSTLQFYHSLGSFYMACFICRRIWFFIWISNVRSIKIRPTYIGLEGHINPLKIPLQPNWNFCNSDPMKAPNIWIENFFVRTFEKFQNFYFLCGNIVIK